MKDIVTEEWRAVKGYDGFYEISNRGRVRSWNSINDRNDLGQIVRTKSTEPIIRKTYIGTTGYEFVCITKNSQRKNKAIHRLVAKSFIPNPENKPCVNHKDGDKTNNHVDNLEWFTYSENHKHAYKNGLKYWSKEMKDKVSDSQKGSKNNNSKLNKSTVIEIRKKYDAGGFTYKDLAEIYGVSHFTIGGIIRRDNWDSV